MDLMIIAHLKRSYDEWKELFDNDKARAEFCDETRTMVGKVNDETALIALFGVDEARMKARLTSPEFAELVADYVVRHDAYAMQPISIGEAG